MKKFTQTLIAVGLGSVLLAGCEGGITGTGADESPVSVGVITGFGSVYVNGIKFETTASKFTLDDAAGLEADLKVGMIVSVAGKINSDGVTGEASHISFADDVEGMVLVNDIINTNTLNILGQTVHVNADTTFESKIAAVTAPDNIATGNIVEVSGFSSGDGNIYATRIEVKKEAYTAGDEIEVTGTISNLTGSTFNLGSLTVAYDVLTEYEDIPNNTLVAGMLVEVKSAEALNGSGHLVAKEIELEGNGETKYEFKSGSEIEIEGLISGYDAVAATFSINGQLVQVDNYTELKPAGSVIANGVKVSVDGFINTNDILIAEEIEFRASANLKLAGTVNSVATDSFTLFGNKVITVTGNTAYQDEADAMGEPLRQMNLANLRAGDYVEVAISQDDAGALVATQLRRDDPEVIEGTQNVLHEVDGKVTNINGNIITIAGLNIDITAIAGLSLSIDSKVEIHGSWNGSTLIATSGEIDTSTSSTSGKTEDKSGSSSETDNKYDD